MPRIQWTDLPTALRDHLFERLRGRKITADDLYDASSAGAQPTKTHRGTTKTSPKTPKLDR